MNHWRRRGGAVQLHLNLILFQKARFIAAFVEHGRAFLCLFPQLEREEERRLRLVGLRRQQSLVRGCCRYTEAQACCAIMALLLSLVVGLADTVRGLAQRRQKAWGDEESGDWKAGREWYRCYGGGAANGRLYGRPSRLYERRRTIYLADGGDTEREGMKIFDFNSAHCSVLLLLHSETPLHSLIAEQ